MGHLLHELSLCCEKEVKLYETKVYNTNRSVGCVLTRNKRIISVGYNGCPQNLKNCFQGGCERCNVNAKQGEDLHKCFCLHAEESAVLECGIHDSKDAALYCTLFPCLWCTKIIIHAVKLSSRSKLRKSTIVRTMTLLTL